MLVNINNNLSPTFEAFPVSRKRIKPLKYHKYSQKYRLVKLNTCNILDIMALDKANEKWLAENRNLGNESNHYLTDILDCAIKKRNLKKCSKDNPHNIQIYAITKQRFYFHWLNYKKILAVAQIRIRQTGDLRLDFIQVRPKYQHANEQRKIKGIGRYFLDCLKALYSGQRISVYPDGYAMNFYKRCQAYPDELFGDMKLYL